MLNILQKGLLVGCLSLFTHSLFSQTKGLTNTQSSKYAKLQSVDIGAVSWTKGFWADRFEVCKKTMVPTLWNRYNDTITCHAFHNFEVAAGLAKGRFRGPSFHDGDFYKTLEAVSAMYASTKDPQLEGWLDHAIEVIGKAQKPDGYIYTKSIIEQKASGKTQMFDDKLSFEAYNFGHLMTAACIHYRVTGKTSLLNIAKKATDFLIGFYNTASPEQARNAICPSHYMGIIEMYRTTKEPRYLALAEKLITIRGESEGTDDNSDRVPFRKMTKVIGHAVRANYLFAGVADVYAETGDATLLAPLNALWDDVINHKMYVTGACGALYDGVSPDGTAYKPDTVQKIHQAYGRSYQLPNHSAHNETCANIGNLLWNWRMLQLTGEAKYADIMELALYNSILSGVNLEGNKFFYTNPLSASKDYPYLMRWHGGRSPYISKSNCCPPNVVRTVAEVNNYVYSLAKDGLYINLYGGSTLQTTLENGQKLWVEQQTNYPWEGNITLDLKEIPSQNYTIYLRIPSWTTGAEIFMNGKKLNQTIAIGEYVGIKQNWKKGDKLTLRLAMPTQLLESNPLVEETRNQVAVKRGPIVYCLESADLPSSQKLSSILIPTTTQWIPKKQKIVNTEVTALEGSVKLVIDNQWKNSLYRPVSTNTQTTKVSLIPYFAWANRGDTEMSVWLPVSR